VLPIYPVCTYQQPNNGIQRTALRDAADAEALSGLHRMTEPIFPDSFILLQQEGFLIHSSVTHGLTALRNAHVGDKGAYYTGFFQLAIGLERIMKAVVILDYMAENDLRPPTSAVLKGHGHKLIALFESMRSVQTSSQPHPLAVVQSGSTEYDILEHLSDFANGARYFNLDTLSSGRTQGDPLERWNRILARILAQDVPTREKTRVGLEAAVVADALSGHAKIIVHGLDKKLLSLEEAVELPALSSLAARYAIYRVFLLLVPLKSVLADATDRVMQLDQARDAQTPSVPYMQEFLQFVWLDRQLILRKKRWP
jgi:hypothetical protein